MFNAKQEKENCVKWIRKWFADNGKDCNAVVGVSGGKDSSVVTALCVEALGADKVLGVIMPNGIQNDIDYAHALINHLHICTMIVNIENTVKSVVESIEPFIEISEQTATNLPPRIRMSTLYAISQSVNGRVANTCNLSEDYVGYSTRYGDTAGDFSPLARFTSDEVIAIGAECGLPDELLYKIPSDGLCGKTDEDNLGFTYAVLNKYIRTGVCEDEEIKKRIDDLHNKNLFKLQPIPHY